MAFALSRRELRLVYNRDGFSAPPTGEQLLANLKIISLYSIADLVPRIKLPYLWNKLYVLSLRLMYGQSLVVTILVKSISISLS